MRAKGAVVSWIKTSGWLEPRERQRCVSARLELFWESGSHLEIIPDPGNRFRESHTIAPDLPTSSMLRFLVAGTVRDWLASSFTADRVPHRVIGEHHAIKN
jgi:hypothetical protein